VKTIGQISSVTGKRRRERSQRLRRKRENMKKHKSIEQTHKKKKGKTSYNSQRQEDAKLSKNGEREIKITYAGEGGVGAVNITGTSSGEGRRDEKSVIRRDFLGGEKKNCLQGKNQNFRGGVEGKER